MGVSKSVDEGELYADVVCSSSHYLLVGSIQYYYHYTLAPMLHQF